MTEEQDRKRRTGRTSRMLAWAFNMARNNPGRDVHIVMLNHIELRQCPLPLPSNVYYLSPNSDRIDWRRMEVGPGNHIVFFDHAVIEHRFGRHLEHMTLFDEGRPAPAVESEEEGRRSRRVDPPNALQQYMIDAILRSEDLLPAESEPQLQYRALPPSRRSTPHPPGWQAEAERARRIVQEMVAFNQEPDAPDAPEPSFSERGIAGMNAPPEPPPPPTMRQILRGRK